jgi:sec-independent protein translocase protein TatC
MDIMHHGGELLPGRPDTGEEGDEGCLSRMPILDHLEDLRHCILSALWGFGLIFVLCAVFSSQIFEVVLAPGLRALKVTGIPGAEVIAIDVTEQFSIIWIWTPFVASLFLGAPWVLWQVWSFISPGLYEREKKWAVPFVICTAGLFILGGLFGYYVALPYGLTFLFAVGSSAGVVPKISVENYFDRFVDIILGIGLVFELPVLVFFLTLIGIASPAFLLKHSRYAILAIVIIASAVTPTVDAVNLLLVTVPMCLLFFAGIFAGYLLVLKRESRKFPWKAFLKWLGVIAIVAAICGLVAIAQFHYRPAWHWPLLVK